MKPFSAFMAAAAILTSVAACGETTTTAPGNQVPEIPAPPAIGGIFAVSAQEMLGSIGTDVDESPLVKVQNPRGQPLAGVRVTFEITSGGGSLGKTETVTGSDGVAGANFWKLGSESLVNTVVARAGGLSATFTAYAIDPNEKPLAHYDLISVGGRPVPYASGWNDLDAIHDLNGALDIYQNFFVQTFSFQWVYSGDNTWKRYNAGSYTASSDGIRLDALHVDALLRGDSLLVGPQRMPDDIIAATVYLKQKQ